MYRRASASPAKKQPQPRSISAQATSCVRPRARHSATASSIRGRAVARSPLQAAILAGGRRAPARARVSGSVLDRQNAPRAAAALR